MNQPCANVLMIYFHRLSFPMRKTIEDHIYCFEQSQHRVYFVNAAFSLPSYLKHIQWDLIVFQTTLLSWLRWNNTPYQDNDLIKRLRPINSFKATKIAFPQDEFLRGDVLCRFVNEFNIDVIFSVSPQSEWKKIYRDINHDKVTIVSVLTGYLHERVNESVNSLSKKGIQRDIDVGYRAWKTEYWLGRFGMLKTLVAEKFIEAADSQLKCDISINAKDVLLGLDWYRFMLRCKYMVGVEGGSSILDFEGIYRKKTVDFLNKNPNASFEEVEKACFSGADGFLKLCALSPRHLEACVTRTCQVLVEGDYNNILKPNIHYIPINKDFSNLAEVIEIIKGDKRREQIIQKAFEDIVESGLYTYTNFVDTVFKNSIPMVPIKQKKPIEELLYYFNKTREKFYWGIIRSEVMCLSLMEKLIPESILKKIKEVIKQFIPGPWRKKITL